MEWNCLGSLLRCSLYAQLRFPSQGHGIHAFLHHHLYQMKRLQLLQPLHETQPRVTAYIINHGKRHQPHYYCPDMPLDRRPDESFMNLNHYQRDEACLITVLKTLKMQDNPSLLKVPFR